MTYQASEHPTGEEFLLAGTAVFQELRTSPVLLLPLVFIAGTSALWRLDADHQENRIVSLKIQAGPLPLLVRQGSTSSS